MGEFPVFGGTVVFPHGAYELWGASGEAVAVAGVAVRTALYSAGAIVHLGPEVRLRPIWTTTPAPQTQGRA